MKLTTASIFRIEGTPKEIDTTLFGVVDPQPTQESNLCLLPDAIEAQGTLTYVARFSDRILPSSVVKEETEKYIDHIAQTTGRKPGRKECREIKEQVIIELLPRAFLRRTHVAFTVSGDLLVIWASSASRVDTIISLVVAQCEVTLTPLDRPQLNPIARGEHDGIAPESTATLKIDTKVVKVKNVSVESSYVQKLIDDGYDTTEVACVMPSGDTDIHFTLCDSGVIKKLDPGATGVDESEDDNAATVLIALGAVREVLAGLEGGAL